MTESNYKCCDDTIQFGQRHVGKMAVVLGFLGVVSSALIGLHLITATSIILGITNLGIVVGGVAYEKIQNDNDNLKIINQNLQEENTNLSTRISKQFNDSPRSVGSIEPVNFTSIHNLVSTAPPSPN